MFIINHIREAFQDKPIPNQDRLPPLGKSVLETLSNNRLLSGKQVAYRNGIAYLAPRGAKVQPREIEEAALQISREVIGEVKALENQDGLPKRVNLRVVLSNLKKLQDLGGGRAVSIAIKEVKELEAQKHAENNVIGRGAVRYGIYKLIQNGTFRTGLTYLGGGLATASGAVGKALGVTGEVLAPVTNGISEGFTYLANQVGLVDVDTTSGAATVNIPNLANYILTVVEFFVVTEAFSLAGHVIRKVTPKSVQRLYKNNMPKSAYNALNFYVFYTPKSRARFYDNFGSKIVRFGSEVGDAVVEVFDD